MNTRTITADVEPRTNDNGDGVGHRLAEPTDDLQAVVDSASVGDRITVEYINTNGLEVEVGGEITEADSAFGDFFARVSGGQCYLHINPSTGDYYFQDHRRESPEDGHEIKSVTVRCEG